MAITDWARKERPPRSRVGPVTFRTQTLETGLLSWPGGLVRFEDKNLPCGDLEEQMEGADLQSTPVPWCRWAGGRDRESDSPPGGVVALVPCCFLPSY